VELIGGGGVGNRRILASLACTGQGKAWRRQHNAGPEQGQGFLGLFLGREGVLLLLLIKTQHYVRTL